MMNLDQVREFLWNPDNILNCAECPYNEGITSTGRTDGPCGQQVCWVKAHIKAREEYEKQFEEEDYD